MRGVDVGTANTQVVPNNNEVIKWRERERELGGGRESKMFEKY